MEDLITKLQDLNRIDELQDYSIQILSNGKFILHRHYVAEFIKGGTQFIKEGVECEDSQKLREEMYKIILDIKR